MCVAHSAAGEQGWYDLRDTGLALFDEPLFFRQIGGTADGAVIRGALARRLSAGYPLSGHPELATKHRIAAYYSVRVAQAGLCAAILPFGPLVIGTPWASSWFHPVNGVLPAFDTATGGHAILAVGWDATGLRLRNSWGADWGQQGEATLPWGQLARVREAWKAVDRIDPRPAPAASWRISVAHGATVTHYALDSHGRLTDARRYPWTGHDSGAPCGQPVVKQGAVRGQATGEARDPGELECRQGRRRDLRKSSRGRERTHSTASPSAMPRRRCRAWCRPTTRRVPRATRSTRGSRTISRRFSIRRS